MDRFEEEKETMAAAYAAKMGQMMGKNKDVMELEADLGVCLMGPGMKDIAKDTPVSW